MKKLSFLLSVVATVATVMAGDYFSGQGTGTTTTSYFIPSIRYPGSAQFEYANCTSDASTNYLTMYTAAAATLVTDTSAASQATIKAVGTGNYTAADIIVVRSLTADTYQRLVVSSVTTTTVVATASLSFALAANDQIWKMTPAGKIVVGNATVSVSPSDGGFWHGQKGRPALIEVGGTSACNLNAVSGRYVN